MSSSSSHNSSKRSIAPLYGTRSIPNVRDLTVDDSRVNGLQALCSLRRLRPCRSAPRDRIMQRIVVLNPKGGSGKTTIAVNLASYFASRGALPVLMDFDPQGSTVRWVRKRKPSQAQIQVIAAFEKDTRTTRAFQLRVPENASHVVVDTP